MKSKDIDINALAEKVAAYHKNADKALITKAVNFIIKNHEGQYRASGEPYCIHPIAVADMLADMRMDQDTIITALLHDTVEDTDVTLTELEREFSKEVARLVDGVTKLTRIELQSAETKQAENFRKLVLAMSEDIRVLLVKLADRTHNMRTLHHIEKPSKRRRIARETLDIFAPLAERIGVHNLKEELEDLAFSHLNPDARDSILARLTFLRNENSNNNIVTRIIKQLEQDMKKAEIHAEISGREKTPYSVWRKMQRKNVTFEQLSDIMAFRIVVDDIGDCYRVLGCIHGMYPTVPGRFKDYISTPKLNGYRSIHTTVLGPEKQKIEIQIRTKDMHEEAELGVAAHWLYKQAHGQSDIKKYRWLRELLDILENAGQPDEFLENTKLELFQDRVFCFTPKGDLIELPSGSCPVDFAYAVHSAVGDRCVGAKINGKIAPLNTRLNNGDQVEIQTSKTQTPSPTWDRFVATGKAKSRIRRFIRSQQRDEYIQLGRAILQKLFKQEGYEYTEKAIHGVIKDFKAENSDDIFAGIGSGHFTARDVFAAVFPAHKKSVKTPESTNPALEQTLTKKSEKPQRKNYNSPIALKGLIPGMAIHFAKCCHPLPGDRIVGIVTTGRGVTVHTIDCDTLESFADTPERWIDIAWEDGPNSPETHIGRLKITIGNEPGALGTLSTVIGKNGGNITNLKILNRSLDFWDMMLDIHVEDVTHLNNIMAALRATPEIASVDRAKGR